MRTRTSKQTETKDSNMQNSTASELQETQDPQLCLPGLCVQRLGWLPGPGALGRLSRGCRAFWEAALSTECLWISVKSHLSRCLMTFLSSAVISYMKPYTPII